MITGPQIRAARELLGWPLATVASRSGVDVDLLRLAEAAGERSVLSEIQAANVRSAFFWAGVEFKGDLPELRKPAEP